MSFPSRILRLATSAALLWGLLGLALASAGGAQVAEGTLAGIVVDPDGKPLAGAVVLVRREATKLRRSTTTNADGRFSFPSLAAGEWKAEASLDGYTVALVGEVWLHVAQTRRLRLVLEPSEFQEMVTQSDYRPLARTAADLGAWVTPAEVANLPLRTRTASDLASLVPIPTATAPSVRLDGALAADGDVPVVAVAAAALLSHSYGAELGGTGGVVSLVTRVGDAATHGSLFGFYTDDSTGDVPGAGGAERTQLGASLGTTMGGDVGLFAAWERHDTSASTADRDWLTAHASWQDSGHVARLRYLGADAGDAGRTDALLGGLQSQPLDGVLNDFRVQWSSDDGVGGDLVQLRDDLYLRGPGEGRHEIAAGAESLSRDGDTAWALYARDRWLGRDRWTVTAAVRNQRIDTAEGSDDHLSPRLAAVWGLDAAGSHLLRSAAGRYRAGGYPAAPWRLAGRAAPVEPAGTYADHVSLGWSWQMSPFLGLNVEAVSVDYDAGDLAPSDYESFGVTVRSRISDVFQVRASWSWTDESETAASTADEHERAVLTGVFHASPELLLAAVYRHGAGHVVGRDDGELLGQGLDLRVARLLPLTAGTSIELLAEVFDVFEESHLDGAERSGQLGLRLRF